MNNFIINQSIKVSVSILEIKYDDILKFSVKKFINQLEPETKKLVKLGSLFFLYKKKVYVSDINILLRWKIFKLKKQ